MEIVFILMIILMVPFICLLLGIAELKIYENQYEKTRYRRYLIKRLLDESEK